MRVRLLQRSTDLHVRFADRVDAACEEIAGQRGVDLIVLPELWATGYFAFDDYADTAMDLRHKHVRRLGEAARESGAHVHAGSVVEHDPATGRLHNTSLLFTPDGHLAHTYRKFHLFGHASKETELLHPGTTVAPATTALGTLGLVTCYDLRFPEMFGLLAQAGVEIFLVTAAWPKARVEHWRLLSRARALENQAYVLACNAAGTQHSIDVAGHSVAVDPWGEVLHEAGITEESVTVELDPNAVGEARASFPTLRDRRLEVRSPTSSAERSSAALPDQGTS